MLRSNQQQTQCITTILVHMLSVCSISLVRCQQDSNRQLAEIKYNVAQNGPLDANFFLPGQDQPLTSLEIENQLNSIMGLDPWQDKFFYENIGPLPYIPREIDIPNPLTCLCSDIQPQQDTKDSDFFPADCVEVEELGLCNNQTFIELMPVQVPEGFCMRTCGRCDCCFSLQKVAKQQNLNIFLQIAAATGFSPDLSKDGFLATVLAPTDEAFEAAFEILGISLDQIEDYVLFLKDIIAYHIIPPHPFFDALWTTPFFVDDMQAETSLQGQNTLASTQVRPLQFQNDGSSAGSVIGQESTANVVVGDLEGCKSYLTIIDNVLLPYDLSTVLGVVAENCVAKQGKVYRGATVGDSSPAASVGECCERCSGNSECNIWQYCSTSEGCLSPDGQLVQQGQCELKLQESFNPGVSEPDVQLQGANVGFISGYTQTPQPTITPIIGTEPVPALASFETEPATTQSSFLATPSSPAIVVSDNGVQESSVVSSFAMPPQESEPASPVSIFTLFG
eukprot:TRINITY_DN2025_c0_g1_i4.p1 TRINITY_DN2025_c0_g1~~TRINITY_DN2025_c0_g1_i4.p1  ORF type:complete len:507 (-),score=74.64 TRINITY_DN2025_c0_g1_i4:345-1865(-)